MKILNGAETAEKIKEYLSKSSWAQIAVAYWGKGAVEKLGLAGAKKRGAKIKVVCDLLSGGCNPDEVKKLMTELGCDNVRARAGLHAKVWITEAGAIIGSSNASANGMGHEGEEPEVKSLIEANIAFSQISKDVQQSWLQWFESSVWGKALKIDESMMETASKRWLSRRSRRSGNTPLPQRLSGSLLERLQTDIGFFKDKPFQIWIFPHDGLSPTAKKGLANQRRQRENEWLDCYEDCELAEGQYILDFDWNLKTHKATFEGLWKVVEDRPFVSLNRTSITLVTLMHDFEGLTIGSEAIAWREAVKHVMGDLQEAEFTAEEFAARLLKPSNAAAAPS